MVELDDIKIFGHSTLQLARKLMETVDDEYGADLWIDCEKREVLIKYIHIISPYWIVLIILNLIIQ